MTTDPQDITLPPADWAARATTIQVLRLLDRHHGPDWGCGGWETRVAVLTCVAARVHARLAGEVVHTAAGSITVPDGVDGALACFDIDLLTRAATGQVSGLAIDPATARHTLGVLSRIPGFRSGGPHPETTYAQFGYAAHLVRQGTGERGVLERPIEAAEAERLSRHAPVLFEAFGSLDGTPLRCELEEVAVCWFGRSLLAWTHDGFSVRHDLDEATLTLLAIPDGHPPEQDLIVRHRDLLLDLARQAVFSGRWKHGDLFVRDAMRSGPLGDTGAFRYFALGRGGLDVGAIAVPSALLRAHREIMASTSGTPAAQTDVTPTPAQHEDAR